MREKTATAVIGERENYTDFDTIDREDLEPRVPDSWRLLDDVQGFCLPIE